MEGFEAVSVLESDDGLGYTRERAVLPEELANNRSTNQSNKSLRDQLAENKERADAEWKIANNPFQPPPSLGDDEREFIKAEIDQSISQRNQQRQHESQEFEEAKARLKSKSSPTINQSVNQLPILPRPIESKSVPASTTVKQSNGQSINPSIKPDAPVVVAVKRKSETSLPEPPVKRVTPLVAYGSDSDDD